MKHLSRPTGSCIKHTKCNMKIFIVFGNGLAKLEFVFVAALTCNHKKTAKTFKPSYEFSAYCQ